MLMGGCIRRNRTIDDAVTRLDLRASHEQPGLSDAGCGSITMRRLHRMG